MGADGAEHHGVAVGRRIGDALGAGHAAGAADVLDHHLLAEDLAHARADHAAEHVGRTAGGERDHHGDRPGRIVLGAGVAVSADEAGQYGGQDLEHVVSSIVVGRHLPRIAAPVKAGALTARLACRGVSQRHV